MMVFPYPGAHSELNDATGERTEGDASEGSQGFLTVGYTSGGDGNGYAQRHGPKIERKIGHRYEAAGELGKEYPAALGCYEGADQHGEDTPEDEQEGGGEGLSVHVVEQGDKSRNDNRHKKIDQHGIGGNVGYIAPQFGGDNTSRCGRGTDHAEHTSLKDSTTWQGGPDVQQQSACNETSGLDGEQSEMLETGTELAGIYLAERQEQHREDEHGLHNGHNAWRIDSCGVEE